MIRTILSLALLVGISYAADAQHLSIGARTGAGALMEARQGTKDMHNVTWEKEIFLRLETKGRMAFETGVTHFNYKYPIEWGNRLEYSNLDFSPSPYEFIKGTAYVNDYAINFSAQYDVSCPFLKDHCPIFKNLYSYIGLNITPIVSSGRQSITSRRISDGTVFTEENTSPATVAFEAGVSHTLVYTLNRFYLTSVVGVNYTEFTAFHFSGSPNFRGYGRVGIGYNLF